MVVRTSKTNGWGQREVKYLVCKGSVGEDSLVDCLVAWAKMAEYDSPADMFFSRRAAGGKSGRKTGRHHAEGIGGAGGATEEAFQHQVLQGGGITKLKALGDS